MKTVEITRAGNRSIGDQMVGMRRWLESHGIDILDLRAVILGGRVSYTATFKTDTDAECFVTAFENLD